MKRVVGAVVMIGTICLGGILSEWMVRIRLSPDAVVTSMHPDSLTTTVNTVEPRTSRAARSLSLPPASFAPHPLAFLSHAPADSLDMLPGIGPVLAARIVEARRARGDFSSWNDVLAVKGIGPRMVARWQMLSARQ